MSKEQLSKEELRQLKNKLRQLNELSSDELMCELFNKLVPEIVPEIVPEENYLLIEFSPLWRH